MVLKEALERRVASVLRPWLRQEAALQFELGIFRCNGSIKSLDLDVSALNSALMQSSPLVMQLARVDGLNAVVLPWRNPVLTLEIRGLHIVMSPRQPGDEFWGRGSQRWTDEQERKAQLLCIDPQGAAVHADAERVVKNESSANWFVNILANMGLKGARIELHDISVELRMPLKDLARIQPVLAENNGFYSTTFRLKSFTIEDGLCGPNRFPGGFLGAAIFSVLYLRRGAKAFKICNIEGLGVELKRPEAPHLHFLVVYDDYVIFLRELVVLFKLKNLQVTDLEITVSELRLGLYPRDLTEAVIILQCYDIIAANAVASRKTRQQVEESKRGRRGGELWRRALEKITKKTPRNCLQQLVETVMLRQRYAQAYELWLREIGWGLKNGSIRSRFKLAKNKQVADSVERLWRGVCNVEKELPVEAVALARRVARRRVLAYHQDNEEALSINFREHRQPLHFLTVANLFLSLLVFLWCLIGSICALVLSFFSIVVNLFCSLSPFNKKGQPYQHEGERHSEEFLNVSGPCYRLTFCKASVMIACDDASEIFIEGSKTEGTSLANVVGPSFCFILEHLFLEYVSDENLIEFCVVCGEFEGQMSSNAYNEPLKERDSKFGNMSLHSNFRQWIGGSTNNHKTKTFLQSSPAPRLHCLHEREIPSVAGNGSNTWNLVMENHEAQMWSSWEKKSMKHKMSVGVVTPTFTKEPFLLCEFKTVLFDPSVKASSSGIMKCGLCVGELSCDLECSVFTNMYVLLLQLLDAMGKSNNEVKKFPSNSSDGTANYSVSRVIGWEVLHESYTEKMKHAMQTIIPDKTIQLTAVIAGPKIHLSASSQGFLKILKQTTYVESYSEVSFVIDLGKLVVAIWPGAQIAALMTTGEHSMCNGSKIEHVWLRRPPLSDPSGEFMTDAYTEHERIGNNAYVKLEDAVVLLENKGENRQLPLLKPLTVTIQSSVCRDQFNSLLTTEKALLANLSCTTSAITIMSYVDELATVIQVVEDYRNAASDTSHRFVVRRRGACPSQELKMVLNVLHSDHENARSCSEGFTSQVFGVTIRPLSTSFAVVFTFELASLDLIFEGSRRDLVRYSYRGGSSRDAKKDNPKKKKHTIDNGQKSFYLPSVDMGISFQHCLMDCSWGDKKPVQIFLRVACIQASVSDSTIQTPTSPRNNIQEPETRSANDVTRSCHKVLTELSFQTCTLNINAGPHVYDQTLKEDSIRDEAIADCDHRWQGGCTSENVNPAVSDQSHPMQLDEPTLGSAHSRIQSLQGSVGLMSSTSSCWLLVDLDLSEGFIMNHPFQLLISEAMQKLSGGKRIHGTCAVGKDFETLSCEIQGGFLVLQMAALAILIRSCRAYQAFLKRLAFLFISFIEDQSAAMAKVSGQSTDREKGVSKLPSQLVRQSTSLSFVSSQVSSEPISGICEVDTRTPFTGTLSFRVHQFSLVLAYVDVSVGEQGILLEADLETIMEFGNRIHKVSFDLFRLTVLGLHPCKKVSEGRERVNHIPHFGSAYVKGLDNLKLPLSVAGLTDSNASNTSEDQTFQEMCSATAASTSNPDSSAKTSHIVECMSAFCRIESVLARNDLHRWKWRDAWNGECSVTGVDIAFTTSEILMLLLLITSLSEISIGNEDGSFQSRMIYQYKPTEQDKLEDNIPDGTIVAIKDVQEHLYLAVEKVQNKHRLIGVLHYSLLGERALFKIKYQNPRKLGKSHAWFSLLSLHARNEDGEPYRVHYQPASGIVDISSVKDKACELWHCIPYKYDIDDNNEELDVYSHLYQNMLHLINQKSSSGLAFINGFPTLVKQPGNPFKLKIFSHTALTNSIPSDALTPPSDIPDIVEPSNSESADEKKVVIMATAVPRVNITIDRLVITILYEATGAIHFLPLLRARVDDAQTVVQAGSAKIRLISTFRGMLESYEAQRNIWIEVVRPIEISVVYRVRVPASTQGGAAFGKLPIYFFSMLKRVDIAISEQTLDVCLFLIGELNIAGPYTVKHSPVTANCCKIENCTGLDLLCYFEDKDEVKITAWQTKSFLIRHMRSRRDLHQEKPTSMTLQLVKPTTVSSSPIHVSLADAGVIALRTRLVSSQGERTAPGPLVVIDVSKQNEDGLSVLVSPMIHVHNASGLSLELRCRRPQQKEDEGVDVFLRDGDIIDDSMGAFDALDLAGELRKALLSFNLGNYLLCVRPAASEEYCVDSETPPSFEWSQDLKGGKAVPVSGLFDKLSYHIKKSLSSQTTQYSFSTIHCSLKVGDMVSTHVHFLVRTTRRKVPVIRPHTSEHQTEPKSSIVAWQEQQEILILPTISVSNLLELEIAVTLSDKFSETNPARVAVQKVKHAIIRGGDRTYMYADLSNLFLVVTLNDLRLTSTPANAGNWGKRSRSSEGGLHSVDIELDFGNGKYFSVLRLSRGDKGLLEAMIYTPYALFNDMDMALLCCPYKQKSFSMWGGMQKRDFEWPPSEAGILLPSKSKISWFEKSDKILIRRLEQNAVVSLLDLELFSGFTEIGLEVQEATGLKDIIKLGISSRLALSRDVDPTHTLCLAPRYIVINESTEDICVCQEGLQEDISAVIALSPGQQATLHMKILPGENEDAKPISNIFRMHRKAGPDFLLFVQFCLKEPGWSWSGPICAASLGHFFLKIRSCSNVQSSESAFHEKKMTRFAVVHVEEVVPSLIMHFNMQSTESLPYRIENNLQNASIVFHQKGLTEAEVLESGATVCYVWDDLSLSHRLIVQVAGTQLCREINLDKLVPWKPFRKTRQNRGLGLQLPSEDHLQGMGCYGNDGDKISDDVEFSKVGYEVYADGPTRVLRICQYIQKEREQASQNLTPFAKIDCRFPYLAVSLLEGGKQKPEDPSVDPGYTPIILGRIGSLVLETIIISKHTLCQLKVQTFEVDEKWQGAPFAALLRVHGQDRFDTNETVLHMIVTVCNHTSNPNQVKYSSIRLQAIDLNIDEDTLMKLVAFYRTSLAQTTPSREIYFECFEIHPIKIVASFLPGQLYGSYTSAQETLRALLHSVIKVPAIRGAVVELNGVLLSHALVTFRQLAFKCAQHYSWYAMRAIYIAKGSRLLPPAFASLFDDSASSSLDVFFDPANGSIDLQGLTIGMFNLLSKGIQRKGRSGTSRYLGDLGRTMKTAGSNVLFAAMREISDNVLKGAETNGFDGMVNGFRHGILKLAMEPSVLSTAVVKGGSSRRIKLDRYAGMDELYIEGYLQAMLDALFKQDYLRVKVVDDQVLLKNLPPNSALIDEIMACVKNFLIGEGLLAGESSVAAVQFPRRVRGESEWRAGPTFVALCEQLFVIFAIRALRKQTRKILHMEDLNDKSGDAVRGSEVGKAEVGSSDSASQNEGARSEQQKRSPKRILTNFILSSAVAYVDGRLCRHIPNAVIRKIVSGFLLSFVE